MSESPTDTFIQESLEGLEAIEGFLLALENEPSPSVVDDTFRALHTIKGSGAMFGFDALARFTHLFENAFELVRDGRLELDRSLIDVSLAARDHMAALLEFNSDPAKLAELEGSDKAKDLIAKIEAITGSTGEQSKEAKRPDKRQTEATGPKRRIRIEYKPAPESLKFGGRPDLLFAEVAQFGEVEIFCDASGVPSLGNMDPLRSYLTWRLTVETDRPLAEVQEVFVFVDENEVTFKEDEPVVAEPASDGAEKKAAGQEQQVSKSGGTTVRVPASRLDDLMDQLGELVIAQTRLDRLAAESANPTLRGVAEEIDRLVTGLRDSTLAMRMLPIEIAFGKFRRVVRSLADELGKDVALLTQGGDTELDKNVIDGLTEPLVHMIRNSIDHGIEPADMRATTGKPERATVALVARQSGGEVLISVSDDGRGLDEKAIRKRAIERGLISEDADLTASELHQMIFEPAFSTAQTVSSVSGRGVGMDAVRRVVNDLRGSIDIRTQKGVGTSITLRLPVTLAIIDGLLVQVGGGVFVLPLSSVNECVELAETEYERKSGRTLMRIREELVPYIKLDEFFGWPTSDQRGRRVVIVSSDGRRIGLVVDDVLGQHQTVIKTFSQFHRQIEGFAGSTILGDGRVALIIDTSAMIRAVQEKKNLSPSAAA